MAKIKLVVSATIEETFSDFIISKKTRGLECYSTVQLNAPSQLKRSYTHFHGLQSLK